MNGLARTRFVARFAAVVLFLGSTTVAHDLYIVSAQFRTTVDWESLWATLTFEVR